jgi:hypothetical protein
MTDERPNKDHTNPQSEDWGESNSPQMYWARRLDFSSKTGREQFRDECGPILRRSTVRRRRKHRDAMIPVSRRAAARGGKS